MLDVQAMADCFRKASDEDTRNAMNVQSTKIGIDSYNWHVVPATWMALAWSIFMDQQSPPLSWREDLAIVNKQLVAGADDVSLPSTGLPPIQQKSALMSDLERATESSLVSLKPDCHYERDFFLLGPNAWLLCKEKFGYDYEVVCSTVDNSNDPNNPLLIRVPVASNEVMLIPFPWTGRFPVEISLRSFTHSQARSSEESNGGSNQLGNVSDDETDDLFPGADLVDDRMSMDNPQDTDRDILLLPAPPSSYDNKGNSDSDDLVGSDVIQRKPYGTGLANLGNTCFMNSTLQCLGHTDPLRRYFLSGEYEKDLNRVNPLGTGGELAIQFAALLGEMWGATGGSLGGYMNGYGPRATNSVVYPRTFKQTLGRHAEQFVGYDQHDSQELAVYLLDALHEDTNQVTHKPYVEKPEKEGTESDEAAALKAWELHLKRDNSRVLSFFMGQIKSYVQCCKTDCGRVSTTFDPTMYLSVPIPGSSERTINVTFVPLNPNVRPRSMQVTINKMCKIKDLLSKLASDLNQMGFAGPSVPLQPCDLCAVDVWNQEIFKWYKEDDEIDRLRDNDLTFIYQLWPLSELHPVKKQVNDAATQDADASSLHLPEWSPNQRHYKLDSATLTRLNKKDEWANQFTKYLRGNKVMKFQTDFNPSRGTYEARAHWYKITYNLISSHYKDIACDTSEESVAENYGFPSQDEPPSNTVFDHCGPAFDGVQRRFDIAVLSFCLKKMRAEIERLERLKTHAFPEGAVIQVRLRKPDSLSMIKSALKDLAAPLVFRVPFDMTVYGLRVYLAQRLSRCLRTGRSGVAGSASGQSTSERSSGFLDDSFGPPELWVISQIPLLYGSDSPSRSYGTERLSQLGCINSTRDTEAGRRVTVATAGETAEQGLVAGQVGHHGSVFMDWPSELFDQHFDLTEYEAIDPLTVSDEAGHGSGPKVTTVIECISKYCQIEQLEESEMWYCNRCKEHVQAWKKFDLYTVPPILIIHLKRFHYSATTHRRDKIGSQIDFPLEGLDLTSHVSHWKEDEKPIYDCYAVSNHFGGLGGGHYTAYCLNDDGSWAHYDDGRITTNVNPKEVVSPAAYCLYYRRRDVPWGDTFPMNLQTPSLHVPAIILDPLSDMNGRDEVSSMHVAMVDEEEGIELDDGENASRATSPMGSIEDIADNVHFDDYDDCPPLMQ